MAKYKIVFDDTQIQNNTRIIQELPESAASEKSFQSEMRKQNETFL